MMVRKLNRLKRQLKQLARAEGNKVDDTDAVFMTAAREVSLFLVQTSIGDVAVTKHYQRLNKILIFVSPELSSVRDYVITHSVRSMCMYVYVCGILQN